MTLPRHETNRFAFYTLRVGATLVRKADDASVYFQPGDDTATAEANADHCFAHADMWPGENARLFDQWAGQYFP
ncbi:hypothetical protein XM25_00695 [Devosia sp. H5989]|nr:hypothetical protein XM25_00695 [Devosia sp. H5989]